jgi:hypothetical protein
MDGEYITIVLPYPLRSNNFGTALTALYIPFAHADRVSGQVFFRRAGHNLFLKILAAESVGGRTAM